MFKLFTKKIKHYKVLFLHKSSKGTKGKEGSKGTKGKEGSKGTKGKEGSKGVNLLNLRFPLHTNNTETSSKASADGKTRTLSGRNAHGGNESV